MGGEEDSASSGAVQVEGGAAQRPPHGLSIVHGHLNDDRIKLLSLDLETRGEECGIIQFSAEFVRPKLYCGGKTAVKDSLERCVILQMTLQGRYRRYF